MGERQRGVLFWSALLSLGLMSIGCIEPMMLEDQEGESLRTPVPAPTARVLPDLDVDAHVDTGEISMPTAEALEADIEENQVEAPLLLDVGASAPASDTQETNESAAQADAASEPLPEFDTVPESEAEAEPQPETTGEDDPESESESESDPELDTDLEAEAEPELEPEPEAEPIPEVDPELDSDVDAQPEPEVETEPEAQAEPDAEIEADAEIDPDAETDPDAEPSPDPIFELDPIPDFEPIPGPEFELIPGPLVCGDLVCGAGEDCEADCGLVFNTIADFSTTQGENGWYYLETGGVPLDFDESEDRYEGSSESLLISPYSMHPGVDRNPIRRWVAPRSGNVALTGSFFDDQLGGGDGATVTLYQEIGHRVASPESFSGIPGDHGWDYGDGMGRRLA